MWCLATDTPVTKHESSRIGLEKIGMILQYADDFMDIDDSPYDGNLVHALLNENQEEKDSVLATVKSSGDGFRLLDIFSEQAPITTENLYQKIFEEVNALKPISPSVQETMGGVVKIILPRIIYSHNVGVYQRIQTW